MRAPLRARVVATVTFAALTLAACGGRAALPHGGSARTTVVGGQAADGTTNGSTTTTATAALGATLPNTPVQGAHAAATTTTTTRRTGGSAGDPTQRAIVGDYEAFLLALSGLDDNLSKSYVAPLAATTTYRLAQASVRQAASLLAAQEHGVGTLRDEHVSVVMTGPDSAALADCQDEYHFYLVNDNSGTPDPFIQRGYLVGSAQMVLQNGHWLVDVFSTTHDTCRF